MESILTKVMNSFPERNSEHIYTIDGVDYAVSNGLLLQNNHF